MATKTKDLGKIAESRYWRREDAEVVVNAWRASGDTLAGFARKWSLTPERISRWAANLDGKDEEPDASFLPVRVVESARSAAVDESAMASASWVGEVCHGDFVVRVPRGFATDEMARLLAVVAGVEPC